MEQEIKLITMFFQNDDKLKNVSVFLLERFLVENSEKYNKAQKKLLNIIYNYMVINYKGQYITKSLNNL